MQPAGGDEHDLIARREVLAHDRAVPVGNRADGGARQLDVVLGEHPRQRRRLAPAPHAARIRARAAPALEQRLRALALQIPLRGAGSEVRVHDERQRADAAEVVHNRRDGVVGDVSEAVDPLLFEHVAGDDRLRAEPLEDERKRLRAELEHERGLATRGVERAPAARRQQRGRRQRLGHRQALAGVERVVVDSGRAVGVVFAHRR